MEDNFRIRGCLPVLNNSIAGEYLKSVAREAAENPVSVAIPPPQASFKNSNFDFMDITFSSKISKSWADSVAAIFNNHKVLYTNLPTSITLQTANILLEQPTIELLSGIDQPAIIELLESISESIQNDITELQIQWIFSLLMILPTLLTADQTFVLRNLCRLFIKLKSKFQDDERLFSLNCFIIIIVKVFDQLDFVGVIED